MWWTPHSNGGISRGLICHDPSLSEPGQARKPMILFVYIRCIIFRSVPITTHFTEYHIGFVLVAKLFSGSLPLPCVNLNRSTVSIESLKNARFAPYSIVSIVQLNMDLMPTTFSGTLRCTANVEHAKKINNEMSIHNRRHTHTLDYLHHENHL